MPREKTFGRIIFIYLKISEIVALSKLFILVHFLILNVKLLLILGLLA